MTFREWFEEKRPTAPRWDMWRWLYSVGKCKTGCLSFFGEAVHICPEHRNCGISTTQLSDYHAKNED